MISERKIKERLLDICAGAGAEWDDEFQYFNYEDDALSVTGRIITACEFAFKLKDKTTRLRTPWRLKDFSDIDSMTKLVSDCLKQDVE